MNESLALAIDARGAQKGERQWTKSIDNISKDAARGEKATKRVEDRMDSFGRTATRIGAVASGVFLGLASIQGARQAISIISGYEESLALLQSVSGATDSQLTLLNETARQFGATTRFSATQAAQGLIELARAGQTVEQQIATLPGVLNLATVGQLDLGRASAVVVSSLAQFGLEAGESIRVVDVLTAASNASLTSVDKLALSLSFAGLAAANINLDVEQTAAALAELANNALSGARGGTNFRSFIAKLVKPTREAERALEDAGVRLEQIDLQVVSFTDALRVLRDAELDTKDAATIFGAEIQAAALALINGVDAIEDYTKEFKQAKGTSQEFADNLNDTLVGATLALLSALQEVVLQMGDSGLTGVMRQAIDFSTGVARAFGGIENEMDPVSRAAKETAAQIKILIAAVSAFAFATLIGFLVKTALLLRTIELRVIAINIAQAKNPFGLLALGVTILIGELINVDKILQGTGKQVDNVRQEVLDLKSALDALDGLDGVINRAIASGDPALISRAFSRFKSTLDAEITDLFADANEDARVSLDGIVNLFPERLEGLTDQLVKPIRKARAAVRVELKRARRDLEREQAGIRDGSIDFPSREIGDPGPPLAFERLAQIRTEMTKLNQEIDSLSTPIGQETVSTAEAIEFLTKVNGDLATQIVKYDDASRAALFTTKEAKVATDEEIAAIQKLGQLRLELQLRTVNLTDTEREHIGSMKQVGDVLRKSNLPMFQRIILLKEFSGLTKQAVEAEAGFELLNTIEDAERKVEVVKRLNAEFRDNTQLIAFATKAEELYGVGTEQTIGVVDRHAAALMALKDIQEQQSAASEVEKRLEAQRVEIGLIGQISESLERAKAVIEFTDLANRAFGQGTDEANAAIEEYIANLDKLTKEEENMRLLKRLGDDMADAFGRAFSDAVSGAKDFDDVLGDLIKTLIDVAFQAFVTNAITSAIGGFGSNGAPGTGIIGALFNAKGNVFNDGNPKYFAQGGVIDQRMIFPLNNGRVGIAGEAGKELAAVPSRLPNGDLGFQIEGQSGGTTQVINIYPQDYDSFRRSSRQLRQDLKELAR